MVGCASAFLAFSRLHPSPLFSFPRLSSLLHRHCTSYSPRCWFCSRSSVTFALFCVSSLAGCGSPPFVQTSTERKHADAVRPDAGRARQSLRRDRPSRADQARPRTKTRRRGLPPTATKRGRGEEANSSTSAELRDASCHGHENESSSFVLHSSSSAAGLSFCSSINSGSCVSE